MNRRRQESPGKVNSEPRSSPIPSKGEVKTGDISADERFRLFADQAADGIFLHHLDGRIVDVNLRACEILGYSRDELLAMSVFDIDIQALPESHPAFWFSLRDNGPTTTVRGTHRCKDGHTFPVEVRLAYADSPGGPYITAHAHDITERLHIEQALKKERDFATRLVETAPVIVLVLNPEGMIEFVNPYFEQLTGYQLDEIRGKEWFATFLPERDRDRIRALLQKALDGEHTYGNINPIVTREGKELEIEWYDNALYDEHGHRHSLLVIGQDVTERKRAEQERSRLTAALDASLNEIYMFNVDDMHFTYVSPGARDNLGFTIEALQVMTPISIKPEYTEEKFRELIAPLLEKKQAQVIFETMHQRADGSLYPVEVRLQLIEQIQPPQFLAVIYDITERKQAEKSLLVSNIRLAEAQAIGHMGHWDWDIQNASLSWSDEIYHIFGLHPQAFDATYEAFLEHVHPDDRELVVGAVDKALHQTCPYSIDHRIVLTDGSVRFVHEQGEARFDDNGEPLRMIGTVQDITERKLAERRILSSLAEKDTLLRELHHRVKNNMQVISSLLSLQARYADTKNPQQALLETRERIRAMALIHERLYGSIDLAAVDMLDYLRYLADRLARLYHEAGVTLNIQVSGEPLKLSVDHALPTALIVNELTTNAIRHAYSTAQRERLIEIRIADTTSGRPMLMVRDYGRGIDAERLNGNPTSLGLTIVRALTRQLDGEIHFEVSNGTVATLSFPVNTKKTIFEGA